MSIEGMVTRDGERLKGHYARGEDAGAVLEAIRSGEIRTVIVGGSDMHGIFRAKRIPAERFLAEDETVVEFSEYMLVMDLAEIPQPPPEGYAYRWPHWSTGFGDIEVVVDRSTLRRVPWLERTALALGDYRWPSGEPTAVAPRSVLRRALERLEALGLTLHCATEFEFHVFRETEASAFSKGLGAIEALAPRPMAYGALQSTLDDCIIGPIVDGLEALRVPVEAWAPEGGSGQYELNLKHVPALEAADQGFLFKHSVKELCALRDMTATFMPKLDVQGYGSSLHVHQSLWRHGGSSAFYDRSCKDAMSPVMRQFVAGQLRTMCELAVLWLPTPTSYKRTVPHSAAGTTQTWGGDNKTVSLRVLTPNAPHCRVEHRVGGSDANPYLAIAGLVAGGLKGIDEELELPARTTGDAYSDPGVRRLPRGLGEAVEAFERSSTARTYLGDEFVDYYAATRRWELEQYSAAVTDWEFRRYFTRA